VKPEVGRKGGERTRFCLRFSIELDPSEKEFQRLVAFCCRSNDFCSGVGCSRPSVASKQRHDPQQRVAQKLGSAVVWCPYLRARFMIRPIFTYLHFRSISGVSWGPFGPFFNGGRLGPYLLYGP
jgi:hypothetical protein